MLSPAEAEEKARHWCDAWNRRDLDAVMSHYDEHIEICSPLVIKRLNRADGTLRGKSELRSYFAIGMGNDKLRFEFEDVRMGAEWLTILYQRENNMRVADTMKIGADGKAVFMVACYGGGESHV